MGLFDGLIGAGISAVGSLLGQSSANNANSALMNQSNAFNAAQTQQQMDFQERMRKTQYQTAVEDLKAAGLNPMLAYTQGGSGTPSGASASSVSPPKMENILGNAANSAVQTAQAINNNTTNELIRAQIHQTDTQSDNIQADTVNKLDLNPNIRTENKRLLAEIAFKDTASRLNSAAEATQFTQARLNKASAANQEQGIAPSSDPYWYRDTKRIISNAKEAFGLKNNFNR
jgi:hypothetical protein